jgi:sugar lactone lactonase YvrE
MRLRDLTFFALGLPILAGCGEGGPTTVVPAGAPRVIAEWGRVEVGTNPVGVWDLHAVDGGEILYFVPSDPSGSTLYSVQRSTGTLARQHVDSGQSYGLTGVAGTPDGTRHVVLFGYSRRVLVMDELFRVLHSWTVPEDPADPPDPSRQNTFLHDVAINMHTGDVVIADASGSRIHRYSLTGEARGSRTSEALQGSTWQRRNRIAILPSGDMVVGHRNLRRFSPEGDGLGPWPGNGDRFDHPVITVAASGEVYVAERWLGTVRKYDADGNGSVTVGPVSGSPRAGSVGDLVVGADGTLIIADHASPGIFEYGSQSGFRRRLNLAPGGPDATVRPVDIVVDRDGSVYVADSDLRRVVKSTPDGGFIADWGSRGPMEQPMLDPRSIAILDGGRILVMDQHLEELWSFDASGRFLGSERLWQRGQLLANDRHMFILAGARISRAEIDARPGIIWGNADYPFGANVVVRAGDTGPEGLLYLLTGSQVSRPQSVLIVNDRIRIVDRFDVVQLPMEELIVDIAVDAAGWVYLAGSRGTIQVYDSSGELRAAWSDPCMSCFQGTAVIDVGPDRSLYRAWPGQPYRRYEPVWRSLSRETWDSD